ncbi:MAG: 1,2-phenylacetyl-CoA epoxidase subunit PaaC [Nocardioides sp.]|uniref:1,2-phenylacetyl-CoA epoxidase subunit PaaC n=1 Tax=Nocardioides sp. TaxID=35761 RepID=UPI003F10E047
MNESTTAVPGSGHVPPPDLHDNAYAGLAAEADAFDAAQWAFGTGFSDPLAGIDTSVPDGLDAALLGAYALALGDDALIAAQRLGEWCSRAPDLEEDLALANLALDLLGQARLLLARAAAADPSLVPDLPELDGSPAPPEDRLAYFRDADAFRSATLLERPNGDFAECVVRVLLHATWRLALLTRLRDSADPVLAAVAGKGVAELAYQRDFAARWVVTLAGGTDESRRRVSTALAEAWPWWRALLAPYDAAVRAAAAGIGADPVAVAAEAEEVLAEVLAAAGLEAAGLEVAGHADLPDGTSVPTGRDGSHTADLADLLVELQQVARAHPRGLW